MTETEWLVTDDPRQLLIFLREVTAILVTGKDGTLV